MLAAARVIARQCNGVLLPDVILPFDDPKLTGITIANVLADLGRFEGTTLADPLEGPDMGVCKARIMRRADGSPWIHSFTHSRTVYELKFDARAVEAALDKAPQEDRPGSEYPQKDRVTGTGIPFVRPGGLPGNPNRR